MTGKQTRINPYLSFNGNCRAAMSFYKEVFSGTLDIRDYSGSPMDIPEEHKSRIMHATLLFGDAILMAADSMPNQGGEGGSAIAISIAAKDVETGEQYFNGLSEDGTVTMPYQKTFWGAMFGMCMDKFGIKWMVNVEI